MAIQTVFKRYELKYLLTVAQKEQILRAIAPYMQPDQYGRTTIRNLYYDTPDYRLIRRSIEKPVYKEKLRVRSYARAEAQSPVFVELKKKYESVVYKRRIRVEEQQAMTWVSRQAPCPKKSQIGEEIDYFLDFYQTLRPTLFLSYEREAYFCRDGSAFRLTFDDTVLCRQEDLSLCSPAYGTPILPEGMVLMELKCDGAMPLWMSHALNAQGLYKTSYSKYGTAYEQIIFPQLQKSNCVKEQVL